MLNIIYRRCMRMRNNMLPVVALLTAQVLSGCGDSDGENKEKKEQRVESPKASAEPFSLQKGRLCTSLQIPGELIAYHQVDLYAKENSFVKKLNADVGSE